jgi:hypothetical protein
MISTAKTMGVEARIIGHCEALAGKRVTISGEHGTFVY